MDRIEQGAHDLVAIASGSRNKDHARKRIALLFGDADIGAQRRLFHEAKTLRDLLIPAYNNAQGTAMQFLENLIDCLHV